MSTANHKRLVASNVISKLYETGLLGDGVEELAQLTILKQQIESSIQSLERLKSVRNTNPVSLADRTV